MTPPLIREQEPLVREAEYGQSITLAIVVCRKCGDNVGYLYVPVFEAGPDTLELFAPGPVFRGSQKTADERVKVAQAFGTTVEDRTDQYLVVINDPATRHLLPAGLPVWCNRHGAGSVRRLDLLRVPMAKAGAPAVTIRVTIPPRRTTLR